MRKLLIEILSSEWLLTRINIPNGGGVIILRTLLTGTYIFAAALAILNFVDPDRLCIFSFRELRLQIIDKLAWLGVIYAFVYTALYARFSSQWSYLANLYNQIKEAECSMHSTEAMAEWKAGFIEDSENLHLATKISIVSIINAWGKQDTVKKKFVTFTPGGLKRYEKLMKITEQRFKEIHALHSA